jgi:hypothetical protein
MTDSKVALPFAGYVRVSRVNGRRGDSFISPDLQRASIERTARNSGVTLGEVVEELDVSGGKDTEARELGRLVAEVKARKYGGIIVWNVKRYSRAWLDGINVFDALVRAGGRLIAEDFAHEGKYARSILSFLLENAEDEREQRTETWTKAVIGSIDRGIHPGAASNPPLGYDWPKQIIDLGDGRTQMKKLGPLFVTEDGPKITAAFEARADGASWSEICKILGVTSQGSAARILSHRVYLGEAGVWGSKLGHVKPKSHPGLVSEDVFNRVQRQSAKPRRPRAVGVNRDWAVLAGGVLRCPACGGRLTPDREKRRYSCRKVGVHDGVKASIRHTDRLVNYVTEQALAWHALVQPRFALVQEVEAAVLPVLEDKLAEANAEREEIQASTTLSALRRAEALTRQDAIVAEIEREIEHSEASQGWLSLPTGRVKTKIAGDPQALNSFVREMVLVIVTPIGQGRRVPPEQRVSIEHKSSVDNVAGGVPATAEEIDEVIIGSAQRKTRKTFATTDEALVVLNAQAVGGVRHGV